MTYIYICQFQMTINIISHCTCPKVFITKLSLCSFSSSIFRNTSSTWLQHRGSCSCLPGLSIRRNFGSIAAKIYYHVLELNVNIILHPNCSSPTLSPAIFPSPLCVFLNSLIICFCLEMGRPPIGDYKTWHTKLR